MDDLAEVMTIVRKRDGMFTLRWVDGDWQAWVLLNKKLGGFNYVNGPRSQTADEAVFGLLEKLKAKA